LTLTWSFVDVVVDVDGDGDVHVAVDDGLPWAAATRRGAGH
jgi:hypothetical protein